MNTDPVGIFDSGLGGLSVLQQVRKVLPEESILYVADSGHAPYGCKDTPFVEQRSRFITERLIEQGVKIIVIACNTATASTIEKFRQDYGIPFVGVEPGIKPAVQLSRNGKIGVLATEATLASERYKQLTHRFASAVQLYNQACPGLADQVEYGQPDSSKTKILLTQYINPLAAENIDTLVLGCTHYSFLSKAIKKITNEEITIVDTSQAVAEQLKRVLQRELLQNTGASGIKPDVRYYSTGSITKTARAIKTLMHLDVDVSELC